MSELPAGWEPVMFIPFGDETEEVGALLKKTQAAQPVVPPSFAVDRDGSLWLLDLVKRRIVHYDPAGRLLRVVGGLEFDRFSPYAQDLGFAGGQLYVHEFAHNTLQTFVRRVTPGGLGGRVRVEAFGHPLLLGHFVTPQPELTGFSEGRAGVNGDIPQGGPTGYQLIDPVSGLAEQVLGATLVDGNRLGVGPEADREIRRVLTHIEIDGVDMRRWIHLVAQPSAESDVRIPITAGWQSYAALPHGLAVYIQFSPIRVVDQDRYRGSTRWLLEYFDDGQPLVWEPVPVSPLKHAYIWRHIAEGLDGHLYLMHAERGGMRIYRRPGPPSH
jgi:hypothetical protein